MGFVSLLMSILGALMSGGFRMRHPSERSRIDAEALAIAAEHEARKARGAGERGADCG